MTIIKSEIKIFFILFNTSQSREYISITSVINATIRNQNWYDGKNDFLFEREKKVVGQNLTDLHKGTHNCARVIRESRVSISPPSGAGIPLVLVLPLQQKNILVLVYIISLYLQIQSTLALPTLTLTPTPVPAPVPVPVLASGSRYSLSSNAIIFPHEWAWVRFLAPPAAHWHLLCYSLLSSASILAPLHRSAFSLQPSALILFFPRVPKG